MVLSVGSVAADTGPGGDETFTQKGKSADAFASGCLSNGDDTSTCWDVRLYVFAGKMSDSLSGVTHADQVCVFRDGYTVVDATGELLAYAAMTRPARATTGKRPSLGRSTA